MHTARIEDVEYEEGDEDDPESQMRKNSDPVMTIVPTLKMTIAPTLRMRIRFTSHTIAVYSAWLHFQTEFYIVVKIFDLWV